MPTKYDYSPTFTRQYKKLSPQIKKAVKEALETFKKTPQAKSLRFHRLSSVKPPVWKIDVYPDHSWQIAMRISGETCTILTVGTHKMMDRTY